MTQLSANLLTISGQNDDMIKIAHVRMKRYIPKNNISFHKRYIRWQVLSTFLIFREVFLVKKSSRNTQAACFSRYFSGDLCWCKRSSHENPWFISLAFKLRIYDGGQKITCCRTGSSLVAAPLISLLHAMHLTRLGFSHQKKNGCEDVKIACFFSQLKSAKKKNRFT